VLNKYIGTVAASLALFCNVLPARAEHVSPPVPGAANVSHPHTNVPHPRVESPTPRAAIGNPSQKTDHTNASGSRNEWDDQKTYRVCHNHRCKVVAVAAVRLKKPSCEPSLQFATEGGAQRKIVSCEERNHRR